MRRYAIYAIPGANEDDVEEAVSLRAAVETWHARGDLHDLTINARRYGFHATLKAPMRLAAGCTEAELCAAADIFAAQQTPVAIPWLRAAAIGSFRALSPGGDRSELNALAAAALREFDHFRAPVDSTDIRQRHPERLTPNQRGLSERWGYPFVLDEFLFHFTLTDAVPAERIFAVDAMIEEHFSAIVGTDVRLTSIAISVEPEPGSSFEILSVHPFTERSALETA